MKKTARRLLIGITLATAAATGTIAATHAGPATTTQADTAWGVPPSGSDTPVLRTAGDVVSTIVTPLDTAWG